MRVLVACEESQEVCKAFRALGHEAYSCDIQECSGGHPEWHIKGNALNYLEPWDDSEMYHLTFETMDGINHHFTGQFLRDVKWDLIIAHPPCTYMCAASACRMYPIAGHIDNERFAKAMVAKEFFLQLYNADCAKICVENPRPLKCVGLPAETQRIQPYEYGESWSKLTYLWLKGLPELVPTKIVDDYKPYVSCGTRRNKGRPEKAGMSRRGGYQKIRSKTFSGIARAMAEQWGGVVNAD